MNDLALAETRAWVERAVIGLQLCPYARAPQLAGRERYAVSSAVEPESLLIDLAAELERLAAEPAERLETTLLIHPHALTDFDDYNEFLAHADEALVALGLEGMIQVASFHPRYQFEDTAPDDITNYTNRSPYPTLHLLREESIDEAVAMHPDTESIPTRNIETMKRLGVDGWLAIFSASRPRRE